MPEFLRNFDLINKNNTMKKMFPHKIAALRSPEGLSSHAALAHTLKAIVSSELKLDKKFPDDTEKSMSQTGSSSKLSAATKVSKRQMMGSNNSSLLRNDESLRVVRRIPKEENSKEKQLLCRNRYIGNEDYRDLVLDSITQLKKEVAEIRTQMYQTTSTDYKTNCSIAKPLGSYSSIEENWTEVCLQGSSSEIVSPAKCVNKSSLEKRLTILEDSAAEDRENFSKQLKLKISELQFQSQNNFKQLNERLFASQSQQLCTRSELQNIRAFFPVLKSHLLDHMDKEFDSLGSRLNFLESDDRKAEARREVAYLSSTIQQANIEQSPCCKKQSQDFRKELGEIKCQMKNYQQTITTLGQHVDRFSAVQSEIKEMLVKLEARLGLKGFTDKLVDVEEQVSQHSQYFEGIDQKINKISRQCEEAAYKLCQIEGKCEQQTKHQECDVSYQQFQETIDTLQTQQDNKLMRVITEYNDNFLTIDQSICDVKDFIQEVLMINKTITQKLQSVWRSQLNGREQLEELYKTSDDVYTLLETNIQRICELSKKQMSFEHEVKELKEKIDVGDMSGTRRRVGSFNASFSDMKSSKLISDIKENMFPINALRSGIFTRPPASLMDEHIQDQSGSFD